MPPPPPQTPDNEESGPPLTDRPGQKAGDFIERDLWNLDEEDDAVGKAPATEKITPRPQAPPAEKPPADTARPAKPEFSGADDGPRPEPVTPRRPTDSLLSLEDDDEESPPGPDPQAGGRGSPQDESASTASAADDLPADSVRTMPLEPMPTEPAQPGAASEFDEEAPADADSSGDQRKSLRLSTTELVSLGILLLAILAGGGWAMKTFFAEIPTRQTQVLVPRFPVRGEKISVKTAETFWREPTEEDKARRSARLIPVLNLELEPNDGRGQLRCFFSDAEGNRVGDPVTEPFSGGIFTDPKRNKAARIEIIATDGFDDEGKHAAYQTSQNDPWIVEVFEGPQAEGPDETTPFEKFTLLFKMPISTDRR